MHPTGTKKIFCPKKYRQSLASLSTVLGKLLQPEVTVGLKMHKRHLASPPLHRPLTGFKEAALRQERTGTGEQERGRGVKGNHPPTTNSWIHHWPPFPGVHNI